MLTEKTDSFETPERKLYFKAHRKELVKKNERKVDFVWAMCR